MTGLKLHILLGYLLWLVWYFQPSGKIIYSEDRRIAVLFKRYLDENARKPGIDGYRIQLYFGNEREKAREVKTSFLRQFSEISANESYQQPNFRVRVGDFRTRLEALRFLKQVSTSFPSAFVVTDQINLREIPKP